MHDAIWNILFANLQGVIYVSYSRLLLIALLLAYFFQN